MIYVVNELCELEQDNYTNCHGAFTSKVEAYKLANDLFNQAEEDIRGESCPEEMKVWNDDNIITISVDEVKLTIDEETLKRIATGAIDHFECLLESNDITIPNEKRTGTPSEPRMFGSTYYNLI